MQQRNSVTMMSNGGIKCMQYMAYMMYRWLRVGDTRLNVEQTYSDLKLLGVATRRLKATEIALEY